MRKIMTVGIAALLTLVAIAAWSNATTYSDSRVKASVASSGPINPLELMRTSIDLPQQQYDAH
jgi:hypothetical protein